MTATIPVQPVDSVPDTAHATQTSIEGWMRQYAQLFAAGTPKTVIAERIGVPIARLERAFVLPAFQALVREYAKESSGRAAQEMLASSGVDTLLTVISIRDDVKNSSRDRLAACAMLMPHAFGLPGKMPKAPQKDAVAKALEQSSAEESIETAIDRAILSKLEQHPELATHTKLSGERRPEQEGSGREVRPFVARA